MTEEPKMDFIQRHGKMAIAVCLLVAGLAYVLQQVNPDTILTFRVNEAVKQTKTDIRHCLSKLAWSDPISRRSMLECTD